MNHLSHDQDLLEDYESERIYEFLTTEAVDCTACAGTGEGPADGTSCPICKGKGYTLERKETKDETS